MEVVKVCTDRVLTAEEQYEATEAALAEREGNGVPSQLLGDSMSRLEEFVGGDRAKREALVMFARKRWANGRTLKVYWMDGPEWARNRAFRQIRVWGNQANLKYEMTADRNASDIRVTFAPGGSWSYIGTDNLGISKDSPTMQLGWLLSRPDDQEEWIRVCVHEGGHAIDFGHEQASPAGKIDWNKEAVYNYYGGPPNNWSRQQVDYQVFQKYEGAPVTNFSAYDKLSIMHYAIPASFVLDPNDVVGWNSRRSATDKRYAALWYPKPGLEAAINLALDDMARAAEATLGEE